MSLGRSVRLFLVNGSPRGIVTAEIMNWTGHVLYTPRSRLAEALKRHESERTGVYLLIGEDPSKPSMLKLYVGEGDTVRKRVKSHAEDNGKEFWTHACMVTSTDKNLTKSHVRYLEGRLIKIASEANRATLENITKPETDGLLPESDASDMEFFIQQLQVILPVVGIDLLRRKPSLIQSTTPKLNTNNSDARAILELQMINKKQGHHADAIEQDGEITVLKGSTSPFDPKHARNDYSPLREQLKQNGILAQKENDPAFLVFIQDFTFKSPSAAASVINGRNSNGRTEWVLKGKGISLKNYQDSQLASIVDN